MQIAQHHYNLFLLLLSVALFSFGQGLIGTIVALKVTNQSAGMIMSTFYLGMLIGSLKSAWLVHKFGPTKTFVFFTICLGLLNILLGMSHNIVLWYVIRFLSGYSLALLYIIVESYLLDISSNNNRVRFLSFYGISLYGMQSASQLCLNTFDITTIAPFALAAFTTCLAILPAFATKIRSESHVIELRLSKFIRLYKIYPASVLCCLISGIIISSIYGLLPKYLERISLNINQISVAMMLILGGSVILKYPIGHFSDKFGRIFTLIACCILSFILCVVMIILARSSQMNPFTIYVTLFLFSGFLFCMYPIGMAYLCENKKNNSHSLDIAQGLLIAYCIGSISGPSVISWIERLGMDLFATFAITVASLLIIIIFGLLRQNKYN